MQARSVKRLGAMVVAAGLLVGAAGAASAHTTSANSKMRFHLDSHSVALGDDVTGPVHLATRSDHTWAPLAGASLSIRVDGTEVATAVTDANGDASVSYTTTSAGGHVLKVFYAGDDTHHKRQRAQGFNVTSG